jgi:alpha-galactosidase
MMQMQHIRGVYRVWDELRRLNPTLVLENCSSGGRRFDLGTFRHAHIHHGSDFNFQNDIIRTQISGLNTVVPSYRVIHTATWGGPESPDMYFQSRFGGILRHSQDFASWPPQALAKAKKHITVYKSIRHLLKQDFYALFEQPRTLDAWDGWQYNDPETGEGFVMIFRMRGNKSRCRPELHGLQAGATYRFVDPYTGDEFRLSGQMLMDEGLPIEIAEKNTAKLLHYDRQ